MRATPGSALAEVVSQDCLVDPAGLDRWAVGDVSPAVVAVPGSVEELAEVLGRASEEGWIVVPAGRGTWLDGGNPMESVDVVLSTRRLDGLQGYEPADLTLTAEAGMTLADLSTTVRGNKQWLPLDPPGGQDGTLGGTLATGSWGPLAAGYGAARDQVLGVELVTGDGRRLQLGGRVVKNVAGFDLVRMTVGSWGSLGVITSASVRLFPEPNADVTLVYEGEPEAIVDLARVAATAAVTPAALEVMVEDRASARLLIRVVGGAEAVDEEVLVFAAAIGADPKRKLVGEASARTYPELGTRESEGALVARLSALPSRLPALLELALGIEEVAAVAPLVLAHGVHGVLRVIVSDGGQGSAVEPLSEWLLGTRRTLEAEEGSLILTRAPSTIRERVPAWGAPGPTLRIMQGLKERFDPSGVLAPGRFVL